MEDKVLIKGEFNFNKKIARIFYALAVITLTVCFMVAMSFGRGNPLWAFKGIEYGYYWFFIGAVAFVLIGIYLSNHETTFYLIVTEGKVSGKTLFGKTVDLPISQISAIGTGILKRVSIATSSGSIHFYGLVNQQEIYKCISDLLIKRQEETKVQTNSTSNSNTDELIKLNDLLKQGIITQEEFDAKKKQLLGL